MPHLRLKNLTAIFLVVIALTLGLAAQAQELPTAQEIAQLPPVEYYRASVVKIVAEGVAEPEDGGQPYQTVKIRLLTGPDANQEITIDYGGQYTIQGQQNVKLGETVVVAKTQGPQGSKYYITDKYRVPSLLVIGAIFFALVVLLGGWRGSTSFFGLLASVGVLVLFIMPRIMQGQNPLLVVLAGAGMIAVLSLYLAHGFKKRTSIALVSTLISLGGAVGLATLFVSVAKLTGFGSEEAFFLQTGVLEQINLRGLLLAGIIIGVLGVLDDVTTGQAAAIDEVSKANPSLTFRDLYKSGISVGREHIASLVNTLVLAYAGASFPLLLLLAQDNGVPLWVTLNGEFLSEEIIRTLVGSTVLVLAVPITTLLAAWVYSRRKPSESFSN